MNQHVHKTKEVNPAQTMRFCSFVFTGERRLKLTGESNRLDVNADFMTTGTLLNTPTLYPSAYLVLTSKGYTKHYYAGADRVAASLGGGGLKAVGSNPGMQDRAKWLFWESHERVNGRMLQENDHECIWQGSLFTQEYYESIKDIPGRMNASVEFYLNDLYDNLKMLAEEQHDEKDVYFYHSDHLGSASWITDADGKPIQHLQYLPFGEPFVNQHLTDYQERYLFTGKERDEETGYGYFGARYMDHELTAMWLSVDPMADKYPSISPYAYCAWNPIKLIDPDGREIGDFYSKDGTYLNTDGKKDGKVYIVKDEAWGTEIMDDRRKHKKNATLNLDKVERFQDENGNDLFLTEDIIKKVSSAENLSSDGNEHGFFYRKNIETPERELKSFPDHLTFNKYSDLVLSIHTHPQEQPAIMSDQDHADLDQIPINIVIGNNKAIESGNVKTSNFPTYRVVNFYKHGKHAFSMNMTSIKKMVKRMNNKNK